MARTSIKNVVEDANIVENVSVDAVEDMNEKEEIKTTKKSIKAEPLEDSDEIEVISLVPNVSYKDSKTLDMYEWQEAGHVEYITFETLTKGILKTFGSNLVMKELLINSD